MITSSEHIDDRETGPETTAGVLQWTTGSYNREHVPQYFRNGLGTQSTVQEPTLPTGSSNKKASCGAQGQTWLLELLFCKDALADLSKRTCPGPSCRMQYTVFHSESWMTYLSYTKAALAPWNHRVSGQQRGSSNPWELLSFDFATTVTVIKRL